MNRKEPIKARRCFHFLLVVAAVSTGVGTVTVKAAEPPAVATEGKAVGLPVLTPRQRAVCQRLALDPQRVATLLAKPLYRFSEPEVDTYLRFLHASEPDLRRRIVHLARKNIGQPYELYLLGELPFEAYDPQPIYCLGKSDCLVFCEHTYAMALGHNWSSFMRFLQRIRYMDGHLGVVTRNHYTEVDWNHSNRWLVHDMTAALAKDQAVAFTERIDRGRFFKHRYGLTVAVPVETHHDVYLPFAAVGQAAARLADGDFVNIVRGVVKPDAPPNATFGGSAWVGHVGLIVHGAHGKPHLLHSATPAVREEPLEDYIANEMKKIPARDKAGKARLLGFKFLRLVDDPARDLRQIDGDDAPRVTLPSGGPLTFPSATTEPAERRRGQRR